MTDTTISTNSTTQQTVTAGNRLIITAAGSLKPSGPAVTFSLGSGGTETVNNSGVIAPTSGRAFDVSGTATGAMNLVINNLAGGSITGVSDLMRTNNKAVGTVASPGSITIDNAGSMTANAGRGFNIQEYIGLGNFTFTNEAGATLQSTDDGIRLTTQTTGATTAQNAVFSGIINIDNSGTIKTVNAGSGQALDLNDVNATSAGHVTVTNRAGGLIQAADADAIRGSRFADIENYGTIKSLNASASSTGNDAIDFQANDGGLVNNYQGGSIIGARHGITGDTPVTVNNDGVITGSLGAGINLDTGSATTTVITNTSHGVITGNAAGSTDGDAVDVDGLVNITNSGTIQALGHATSFVAPDTSIPVNEALAIGGGTVLNNVGGLIYSDERAITVDDSNNGNAFGAVTITNHGTITGNNGSAIVITGTRDDTVSNDGTINGSVNTGGGNDSVTNSGTFNGALATGDGNDSITLSGSATPTAIDGGIGTDSILVNGAATALSLGGVTNVELLEVDAGIVTLTSSQSYANGITLKAGTLELAAQVASTPSVAFSGSDAGTLIIDAAAVTAGDFATQINGLGLEDTIELKGFGVETTAVLGAGNVLTLSGGSGTVTLHLDPTQDFSAYRFHVTSDGGENSLLTYGANFAPALTGSAAVLAAGTEDTAYTIHASDLLAGFTDGENDTLTVTGLAANHGTLVNNNDGTYSFTPAADYNGPVSLTYNVDDGHGGSTAASQRFNLAAVNDVPALTGTAAVLAAGTEDTAYTIHTPDLLAGFADADNDTLSVANLSASHGTLVNNNDGTYTFTPAANYNGTVSLTYNVVDGQGGSTPATQGFSLAAVNDAPDSLSLSANTVAENSAKGTVVGTVAGTDPDTGNTLHYTLLDNAGGRFAVDADTGVVTVDNGKLLDYETANAHLINVRVTDQDGLSYDKQFEINLTNVAESHSYAGTAGADVFTAPSDDVWYVNAKGGDDIITTGAGNDVITGAAGNDTMHAGAGDDIFFIGGGAGVDSFDGGIGYDRIIATADKAAIGISDITGVEEISSGGFDGVKITGSAAADTLNLSGISLVGIESINGGNGNDIIIGSSGDDHIIGGAGADTLTGGAGSDFFVYTTAVDSGIGVKADHITDFVGGIDLIDLSGIDADTGTAGNQAFTFIGSGGFTGAGQIRIGTDNGHVALFANTGGNLNAEIEIVLDNNATIHLADLIL